LPRVVSIATLYNTLQHTATHCNTLKEIANQHSTMDCLELPLSKHSATHCNKLQHTATHCNTLQRSTATGIASSLRLAEKKFGHPAGMQKINLEQLRRNKPKTAKFSIDKMRD